MPQLETHTTEIKSVIRSNTIERNSTVRTNAAELNSRVVAWKKKKKLPKFMSI